jgi:DNA polymerase III subunit beta
MKFTVGREALGEAVAFVARALSSRPVVPLLSGMLLDAGPDGVVLSCFDYEVSARATVEADVIEPGTALVPGRLLAEITKSLPAQPVEFADDGEVVNLSCGRAEFGLVCLPVRDYPALPKSPPPVGVVDGGALACAVGQVAPAASRDDTLPMLTAVCLDINGPLLTLAATDRYRLAVSEVPFAPAEPDLRAIALVPAKIMVDAARTLDAAGAAVTIAFAIDAGRDGRAGTRGADDQPHPAEGLISLDSGDRRLTARLIGGEFIKYRSRFPDEFGSRADIPAGPMIAAVRRAALVTERAGPVRLSFRPDVVTIEAHAEGKARAAETVGADFVGEHSVMTFNPHHLLDGLTAALATGEEQGRIRLEFTSAAKPALITWAGQEGAGEEGAGEEGAGEEGAGEEGAGQEGAGQEGAGQEGAGQESAHEQGAGQESEGSGAPAFRYLVVPLRVPARG